MGLPSSRIRRLHLGDCRAWPFFRNSLGRYVSREDITGELSPGWQTRVHVGQLREVARTMCGECFPLWYDIQCCILLRYMLRFAAIIISQHTPSQIFGKILDSMIDCTHIAEGQNFATWKLTEFFRFLKSNRRYQRHFETGEFMMKSVLLRFQLSFIYLWDTQLNWKRGQTLVVAAEWLVTSDLAEDIDISSGVTYMRMSLAHIVILSTKGIDIRCMFTLLAP